MKFLFFLNHSIVELIVGVEKKLVPQPGTVTYACKPVFRRPRQEDDSFRANLCCVTRFHLGEKGQWRREVKGMTGR